MTGLVRQLGPDVSLKVGKAMKTLSLIIQLVLCLASCAVQEIDFEQLKARDYVYYVGDESKPYSGRATEYYPSGQLRFERVYENGEEKGLQREWYENGQLSSEGVYENGEMNGLQRAWYENGQLMFETVYENSEAKGPHREWYENGQLRSEDFYENGEEEGLQREWYKNGQLLREETIKGGWEGNTSHRWWYENGQLMWEGTFEEGKPVGLHRIWTEKGELLLEETYVNGKVNGSTPSVFVGVWKGRSEYDGRVWSWKNEIKPDGSYKIEFKDYGPNGWVSDSEEEGQWWVKNGYFYEQVIGLMRTPDIYLYQIIDGATIKFSGVWLDANLESHPVGPIGHFYYFIDDYEFISNKQ
jgi:antitoxin component YwqK of YwqJK toxin-antitoxin module